MSKPELLGRVVRALNEAGIPFMLTGSTAAAWHGSGRATLDIDFVIDPAAGQLDALVAALEGPGIYVSADAAREAVEHESMFNVVDITAGWKADLIIRKSRPFSRVEFERRVPVEFEGNALWVATAEDLIIAKLEWGRLGGSARQIEDVSSLLRIGAETLDREYLDKWIGELGLMVEWRAAVRALEST